MDLIYMNSAKEDIGVLMDYEFDLAFGTDENNFECRIDSNAHCCEHGYFLYIEGTEYGGIIDALESITANEEVIYTGRTWHGILNSKVIEPDSGKSHLIVSGEANEILASLIDRLGLSDLFEASSESSDITISNYQFSRYIEGYDGIKKMLESNGAKLKIVFYQDKVILSAVPVVDYTQEAIDSDTVELKVKQASRTVNHLICLGQGELENRTVIHLYADTSGNISQTQTQTGIDEYTAVYDYSNAEDEEELIKSGTQRLKELMQQDSLAVDFDEADDMYDVGDIVGAEDAVTGVAIAVPITKKIVTVKDGIISIDISTDTSKGRTISSGGGSGGGSVTPSTGGTEEKYAVGDIFITTRNGNPNTLLGYGTWEQIKDQFLLAAGDSYAAGSTGGEATHKLTVDEMPSHGHERGTMNITGELNYNDTYSGGTFSGGGIIGAFYSAGSYSQDYYISGRAEGSGWPKIGFDASKTWKGETSYVGESQPHNNMPPYLAVNMWLRTA